MQCVEQKVTATRSKADKAASSLTRQRNALSSAPPLATVSPELRLHDTAKTVSAETCQVVKQAQVRICHYRHGLASTLAYTTSLVNQAAESKRRQTCVSRKHVHGVVLCLSCIVYSSRRFLVIAAVIVRCTCGWSTHSVYLLR